MWKSFSSIHESTRKQASMTVRKVIFVCSTLSFNVPAARVQVMSWVCGLEAASASPEMLVQDILDLQVNKNHEKAPKRHLNAFCMKKRRTK